MTRDELEEFSKYELPEHMLAKLRNYIEQEPKENEESAVTFEDEYTELQYDKDVLEDNITDADLAQSKAMLEEVMRTREFQLDQALDEYDPEFTGYIPSEEAFEFFSLMRLVEGQDFEFNTPIAHYFMVDLLLNNITDPRMFPYSNEICDQITINHLRIAFMCSRGIAKSSVVISFFGVYSAIKGKLPNGIGPVWFYLILAASSRGGARVNALAVRAMCEDSRYLQNYFEEMRFTETESEFVRKCPSGKTGKDAETPRKNRAFLMRYQGVGTGVRGIRYGQRRICTILLDDIILNEAAAYSKTITENLESVIHSDSVAALKGGGKGRIIDCFTPFNYTDVNTRLVMNGAYTPCVIPIAKNFDAEDTKLTPKDIHSTWVSYHPGKAIHADVVNARKTRTLNKFMQERMLRLTSGADRLVSDESLNNWYNIKDVMNNIANYTILITTDYTTSSGEKKDFSGRATWAISSNDDWFLLDLSLRRMGIQEQYRDTIQSAATYKRLGKYVEIGVEIDGNQLAHIDGLSQMMRREGTYYTFARQRNAPESRIGILSKGSGVKKHERFRIVAPRFTQKKIFFPEHLKETPDMRELLSQIKGATHSAFTRADDGPDLFSMLEQIDYILPVDSAFTKKPTYTDSDGYVWEKEEVSAYDSY